jgi:signal transduction histidine kinase
LAIAKLLAELHGGSLWLESTSQQGTTAHVELPVAPGLTYQF